MSEVTRIADELRRSHEGEAWHGPPLEALLAGVSAAQAAARPIPDAHSIWELVLHIAAWERFVTRRLAGETIVDVPDAENFPPVTDTSPAAWERARDELRAAQRTLQEAVGRLTDERLRDIVSGKGYSVYFMLHGVIQHNLYHAGQIALLKKAAQG
jgi:uncharacterized damage-inducible protein DinB